MLTNNAASQFARARSTCLLAGVILLGCWASAAAATQASDFAFRFEYGACGHDILDTFTGVFTKDLGGDPGRSVTTQLSLADSQKQTIYQALERVRFFDLPSPFIGVPLGVSELRIFHPALTYRLEVRNAGVVHSVVWKDSERPSTVQADQLRALCSMLIGFIQDRPEVKRLPKPIGGCE